MTLSRFLALEQSAFLRRPRRDWAEHLVRARDFTGKALDASDPARPVLILGAGSGLEIPWSRAPRSTVGWDADPWSRVRTALRHRRWVPWVFEDFTGGFAALEALLVRVQTVPGTWQRRDPQRAVERLVGLMSSLRPRPLVLESWLEVHRPGTVILANVLGQIGYVAQILIEKTFGNFDPWNEEMPISVLLMKALDDWTLRLIQEVLQCLARSGAQIWMIHDRVVIWGEASITMGPLCDAWMDQIQSQCALDVTDPLCGFDPNALFATHDRKYFDRWIWFLTQGQLHIMEALAYSANGSSCVAGAATPIHLETESNSSTDCHA